MAEGGAVTHQEEIERLEILVGLDHELGIVDEDVRTKPVAFSLFWNTFTAIRTKQPCSCEVVAAYYEPFPNMSLTTGPIPPMCAHCFGDLGNGACP